MLATVSISGTYQMLHFGVKETDMKSSVTSRCDNLHRQPEIQNVKTIRRLYLWSSSNEKQPSPLTSDHSSYINVYLTEAAATTHLHCGLSVSMKMLHAN